MDRLSNSLLFGFWAGFVITTIAFTFLLVNFYTSNDFLRSNNIYLDGQYYKLCKRSCK